MYLSQIIPVTEAVFRHIENPDLGRKNLKFEEGFCGSCQRVLPVVIARRILSKTFGSWELIKAGSDNERRLCEPCAYGWRDKKLVYHPCVVENFGEKMVEIKTGEELRQYLKRPLPHHTAITLPISCQKALTPIAEWGKITVDSGPMPWTKEYGKAVGALLKLRELGFREGELAEPSPGERLTKMDVADRAKTYEYWGEMSVFQSDQSLFPALIKITRKKLA